MPETTVVLSAYLGSDTPEAVRFSTLAGGTRSYINWSVLSRISLSVYDRALFVVAVDNTANGELFKIDGEWLELNLGKITGLIDGKTYTAILKAHDPAHPDGQVLADTKSGNNRPTLSIKTYKGV